MAGRYVRKMRPEWEYQKALELIKEGINDCEIGRRLGIPRGTIQDWRVRGRSQSTDCPRCGDTSIDEEAYSYLLGVYLGDGCLSEHPRDVYKLRVSCDLKYPDIIDEIATHIVIARGADKVGFVKSEGCVEVYSYWKHWICLFPQHAPGRKHERSIALAPWQQDMIDSHTEALIRGLIHSDGNRHINPITRRFPSGTRHYRYTRYMFTNASTDILGIFTEALDSLGVHWTQTMPRVVSVARREDVALLDTFVGPKS